MKLWDDGGLCWKYQPDELIDELKCILRDLEWVRKSLPITVAKWEYSSIFTTRERIALEYALFNGLASRDEADERMFHYMFTPHGIRWIDEH